MAKIYIPPKQGVAGQLFDVAFLLALVAAALFLPLWLKIAVPSRVERLPEGVSYRLLVLPAQRTMSPQVMKKIRDLIEAGQRPA